MQSTISVVVPTRNRPDHIEPCVGSILLNPDQFELVVIDQSDDDASERALHRYQSDGRFRLVRSAKRGASNARNQGIGETRGALIAFTDDDCRVAPDWLSRMTGVFAQDETVEIVFGRVSIPQHLQGKGFAADFEPHQRAYRGAFPPVDVPWGIGANMAVRRRLVEQIGAFDLLLGPGAPFNAGEEFDLMIRALAAGSTVINAREVHVEHLGVREGNAAAQLMRGYGVAVGATLAKHVRLRTPGADALFLGWALHFGGAGLKNAIAGKRPTGLGLVAGMLRGAYLSWRRPLDRGQQVYR
jgi:glycosyltransferase involved in cell wall biosynthesis